VKRPTIFSLLSSGVRLINRRSWTAHPGCGRYAVILQDYDESLKPSDVSFIKVSMWVRILDLSFEWMNAKRGGHAVSLIGEVLKIQADSEGKANGLFCGQGSWWICLSL
jgi:hypothetical protein